MPLTIALYGNHRGRLIGLQAIVNQVWGWSLLHYTFVHKYSYLGNTIIFIFPYNFVDKSPQALGFPNKLCCSRKGSALTGAISLPLQILKRQWKLMKMMKVWCKNEYWYKYWRRSIDEPQSWSTIISVLLTMAAHVWS